MVNSEKSPIFDFSVKGSKIIIRVNSVIFQMLEKIPEYILNMNFMNFAGNFNLELDLKIKKIIFKVNFGIFQGHEKSRNSP